MIEKNERENLGLLKEKYKETFSDVSFNEVTVSFSFLDLKITIHYSIVNIINNIGACMWMDHFVIFQIAT
jgi:hypothetical protein